MGVPAFDSMVKHLEGQTNRQPKAVVKTKTKPKAVPGDETGTDKENVNPLSDYEKLRLENIERNRAIFAQFNLTALSAECIPVKVTRPRKRVLGNDTTATPFRTYTTRSVR
jgi:hypothetical protein